MTRLCQLLALRSRLDSPAVTKVALTPVCEECRKVWLPADAERWRAYWLDDGPEEKLLFYCAACARREFGAGAPAS